MSKKLNGIVIIFLIIFLTFSVLIIYERINGKDSNISTKESSENLSVDSSLVQNLYNKIDIGGNLIENYTSNTNLTNDIKLLIVSGNLKEENLIKGTAVKNENTGLIEKAYLLNSSLVKEKYEEIFGPSYTATPFISHSNLFSLSFDYDEQTKMYYCNKGCVKNTNPSKIYKTKLVKAISLDDKIILNQAIISLVKNQDTIIINDLDGNQITSIKDENAFVFTDEILKKASIYKITFTKNQDKYYLTSIGKE